MNPVTRRLLDDVDDPELAAFALAWDALEECLVQIYRAADCPPELATRHAELRASVESGLDAWEPALQPHWMATRINGAPPSESPFLSVVAVHRAGAVVGDRDLMRTLPAAREALNHLLLERAVRSGGDDTAPRSS
jgi:hypothetical protein